MNPRAAINDLLPFQGSPFSHLGTSPNAELSGEDGIRTHVPLRTNGFQDRLVMTTSIPLHVLICMSQKTSRFLRATLTMIAKQHFCVNNFFNKFFLVFNNFYFYYIFRQKAKKIAVIFTPLLSIIYLSLSSGLL